MISHHVIHASLGGKDERVEGWVACVLGRKERWIFEWQFGKMGGWELGGKEECLEIQKVRWVGGVDGQMQTQFPHL